ncbi:MAG: hypothetical protein GY715_13600 [Planctomycetes bacterium]|nr:hypothetical protein [Planctomycetota bacterium]
MLTNRTIRWGAAVHGLALLSVTTGALAGGPPTVGPQQRIDPGGGTFSANETTASASAANPLHIIAGWNDWRLSPSVSNEVINTGFALSLDGGQTWSDFLIRPPVPNQSGVEGDPMTAFDANTGTLWAGAISFSAGSNSGIYVARKNPGSSTFEPSVMARTASGTDKCWMAAGLRPPLLTSTRLYITYNEGVIWSDDMGDTWTDPISLGSGIGFLPRVGPQGQLYVAYWDFNTGMLLKRSLDGGQTFTDHTIATRMDVWDTQSGSRFPGNFRVPSMVHIAVHPVTGHLYATYFDTTNTSGGNSNVDVYFTKSVDQGTTWTTPVPILDTGTENFDQFFTWIEVDADGRLHLVYYDTKNTVQNDNVTNGMFDAYYAYSEDDGATWTDYRLSNTSWDSNDDGLDRATQFIGDYLGLAVAGNRAYPVYLDTSAGDADIYTNVIDFGGGGVAGDANGDGVVNFADILVIIGAWGTCPMPPAECPADVNGDTLVNFADILVVIANWTI